MSTRVEAQKRTALLKELRAVHEESVARTQALLKEQKGIRKQLCQALRGRGKTIPELAELIDLPAGEILWHITAMKKYDLVVEVGMCGEYYQYQMAEDRQK